MRPSPLNFRFSWNAFRRRSVLLLMLCAVNVSGCNNGKIRSVQRPRFLTNPFRRPAIVVNPGLDAIETPGSVVVEQPGSVAPNTTINGSEPPATQLEARPGGTVTNIVPSFEDARPQPTSPESTSKYNNSISGGISGTRPDSPPPATEAPKIIMDNPPIGGSGNRPTTNPPLDSATSPASGSGTGSGNPEPRLEYLEPRRPGQSGSGSSSSVPENKTGGSTSPGTKPSAWRSPKFGDVSGRTTYQTSNRSSASDLGESTEVPRLGVLD